MRGFAELTGRPVGSKLIGDEREKDGDDARKINKSQSQEGPYEAKVEESRCYLETESRKSLKDTTGVT